MDNLTQVAACIDDLKRLLLFLSFEDFCQKLANTHQLEKQTVIELSLDIIDEPWLTIENIQQKILSLPLNGQQYVIFLQQWRAMMQLLPEYCYRDNDHKHSVLDTMIELLDKWNN